MPIKLTHRVGVRFDAGDHRRLEQKAQSLGLTVSQLIRQAALDLPAPPRRRSLVDSALIQELSRIGNNLNQQTRLLHQLSHRGLNPETAPVLAVLEEVRDLLAEVSRRVTEASL